jgi:hypothetical protein
MSLKIETGNEHHQNFQKKKFFFQNKIHIFGAKNFYKNFFFFFQKISMVLIPGFNFYKHNMIYNPWYAIGHIFVAPTYCFFNSIIIRTNVLYNINKVFFRLNFIHTLFFRRNSKIFILFNSREWIKSFNFKFFRT